MNANIVKTLNYIKRNGPIEALYAIRERIAERKLPKYEYRKMDHETRLEQLSGGIAYNVGFSILVPAYETPVEYLKGLIDSVETQTYANWELIIADASLTDAVKNTVSEYSDARIRYISLGENKGISENTNSGLKACTKEYVGLLDHDDLLTEDALFSMAKAVDEGRKNGIDIQMIYSDEDKSNAENTLYFEPNIKPEFNYDLLLSNNYICHFLVMNTRLAQKIGFRSEYDGAQDHDFILRCVKDIMDRKMDPKVYIYHIDRVLYHWRCHDKSTALNPKSKSYAYDAGRRAVEDHLKSRKIEAKVTDSAHVGFFDIEYSDGKYSDGILSQRPEVAAIGCRVIGKGGLVTDGVFDENMQVMFKGLDKHNSGGYLHRAHCMMEVFAVNINYMIPSDEGMAILSEMMQSVTEEEKEDIFLLSKKYADLVHEKGMIFVYNPRVQMKELKKHD